MMFFKKQKPSVELPVSDAILQSLAVLRQQAWEKSNISKIEEALRHLEYIYGHSIKKWSCVYRRCLFMKDQEKAQQLRAIYFLKMEDWILR